MSADMWPGREFSHAEKDGLHIPLRVRRRGDNAKDITLVVPPGMAAVLRNLLDGGISDPPSTSDTVSVSQTVAWRQLTVPATPSAECSR
jgi:hypothetical protein